MKLKLIIFLFVALLLKGSPVSAEEIVQVPGVIHVHSTFSSGEYSLEQLVEKAKRKGLGVLILTDHDLVVMEYGLFPLRHLIKRREERPSVIKSGPEKFLNEIARINRKQKDVLVIPGVQSSPFYYWTGNPFKKNLVAHDYRKEQLIIGMQNPADYRGLPLLHRGFSTKYIKELLPQSIFFVAAFLLGMAFVFQRGVIRITGICIAIISLLMIIDHHPFKSSRFDPYHGDQGAEPFQENIDYARQRKGLVFWAHPESNYAVRGVQLGPAKLMTKHYPDILLTTKNYTGFSAIYGDTISATDPGKHWDRALRSYCKGDRKKPAWGISGADFHVEKGNDDIGTFQTIFLVRNKTSGEILTALSKGRVYAVRKGVKGKLILKDFKVTDSKTDRKGSMGEELNIVGKPVVSGRLFASDKNHHPVKVTLVRNGKMMESFEGETPLDFTVEDKAVWKGKIFYRLEVRSKKIGRLLSNPIFAIRPE